MDFTNWKQEFENIKGNHFMFNEKERNALLNILENEKLLAGVSATYNKSSKETYAGGLALTTRRTIFVSRSAFGKNITLTDLPLPSKYSFEKQGILSQDKVYIVDKTFSLWGSEFDNLYSAYRELLELQKQDNLKDNSAKNSNTETNKSFSDKSSNKTNKKAEKRRQKIDKNNPNALLLKELNSDKRFNKLSNENQGILLNNKKEYNALTSLLKNDETVHFISRATYMKEHAVLTFAITKYNIHLVRRSAFHKDIILTFPLPKIEDYTFTNNPFGAIADIKIEENILKVAFNSDDVYKLRDAYNKLQS